MVSGFLDGRLLGVVEDFDGTIAETTEKNYNVTRKIVGKVLDISEDEVRNTYSFLRSYENYLIAIDKASNWQDIYRQNTNMNEEQIREAGEMWTEAQLDDHTHAKFFDGIEDTIVDLVSYNVKQAVVSQNSKENIMLTLGYIHMFFSGIVGYEQVGNDMQKPHPNPLVMGIESFNPDFNPGYVISIGDHPADSEMAARFNKEVNLPIIVVHYAAKWGMRDNEVKDWEFQPYGVLVHPSQVLQVVQNFHYMDYEMLENGVLKRL